MSVRVRICMVLRSWLLKNWGRLIMHARSPHTCLVDKVTPIFLGQYSTSTTRMTLVALGTCKTCSKSEWIETEFDAFTTSWLEHLTNSCTWSSMALLLIVHTPLRYKLITKRGSLKSKLLSVASLDLTPSILVRPSK